MRKLRLIECNGASWEARFPFIHLGFVHRVNGVEFSAIKDSGSGTSAPASEYSAQLFEEFGQMLHLLDLEEFRLSPGFYQPVSNVVNSDFLMVVIELI
jgi:hypothetical protein